MSTKAMTPLQPRTWVHLPLIALMVLGLGVPAIACPSPTNRTPPTAYQLRDNNRCEGIRTRDVSGGIRILAFGVMPSRYGNTLPIRVPGVGTARPNIVIIANDRGYQLDNLRSGTSRNGGFQFDLPTTILRTTRVSPAALRATAILNRNGRDIFYPVLLAPATSYYDLALSLPTRTNLTVQIRQGNRTYFNQRLANANGEVRLRWNYGNAPNGEYQLILNDGRTPYTRYLQHNRTWR